MCRNTGSESPLFPSPVTQPLFKKQNPRDMFRNDNCKKRKISFSL